MLMPRGAWMDWNTFLGLDYYERASFLKKDNRLFHLLYSQQFNRDFLDYICSLSTAIRRLHKTPDGASFLGNLLSHKLAMLWFKQESSRTYLSFESACQLLGMKTSDIRDPNVSSEVKGESQEDSIQTFSSYFDLIIMRHPCKDFVGKAAWVLNNSRRAVPVINGGSGKDQHPTQALLDIYTLERSFENRVNPGIDGKTIMFVGDLKRGRTVRSLAELMRHYKDVKLIFAAPKHFAPSEDLINLLLHHNVQFRLTRNMHNALKEVDAVYMTRIQDEHDEGGHKSERFFPEFSIGPKEMDLLNENAVVMHPGPRRGELDPAVDNDPRVVFWRQMRNGMWVRAALIAYLFNVDSEIPSKSRFWVP